MRYVGKFLGVLTLTLSCNNSYCSNAVIYVNCLKTYKNYGANYRYEYPAFIPKDVNLQNGVERINESVKKYEDEFINKAIPDLKEKNDYSYSYLNITYDVYNADENFISICLHFTANTQTGSPALWDETFNYYSL